MNIVKFGGSIVNPDGKYDNKVIKEFISLVKNSEDKFIFVVGGGKICRLMQDACQGYLETAMKSEEAIDLARDSIGIAATKINARYVLRKFREEFGDEVYLEIILDPTAKVETKCRVFFAGGWKPGHSTDTDMMLLAEAFSATRVFKISDFPFVKRIKPTDFAKLKESEREKSLTEAEDIKEMSWQDLKELVGEDWIAGLNTPFDPVATKIGNKLGKRTTLYIGKKEEFFRFLDEGKFDGTVVKG